MDNSEISVVKEKIVYAAQEVCRLKEELHFSHHVVTVSNYHESLVNKCILLACENRLITAERDLLFWVKKLDIIQKAG